MRRNSSSDVRASSKFENTVEACSTWRREELLVGDVAPRGVVGHPLKTAAPTCAGCIVPGSRNWNSSSMPNVLMRDPFAPGGCS